MSVQLTITWSSSEFEALPIATQRVFAKHWLPGAYELDLKWVPLFESGIPLAMDDLPAVMTELQALGIWTEQHVDHREILPRIKALLDKLAELRSAKVASALFVG